MHLAQVIFWPMHFEQLGMAHVPGVGPPVSLGVEFEGITCSLNKEGVVMAGIAKARSCNPFHCASSSPSVGDGKWSPSM
jgi:hypothetical protein